MGTKLWSFSIFTQVGTQKNYKYLKETNTDYQLHMSQINSPKDKEKSSLSKIGSCPVTTSLSVIGGKWKVPIVYVLHYWGTHRFGELRKKIPGVTQKMLTQQLRELEADGLVRRKVYAEVPPRVEYSMTEYGKTLNPILCAMADWGELHIKRTAS